MIAHDRPQRASSAEEIVLYEKDPETKIATITLNRPDRLNAPTIAARHRFADLVHRANVDDDVKVLVIRGVGEHFGSGADLEEQADMFAEDADIRRCTNSRSARTKTSSTRRRTPTATSHR